MKQTVTIRKQRLTGLGSTSPLRSKEQTLFVYHKLVRSGLGAGPCLHHTQKRVSSSARRWSAEILRWESLAPPRNPLPQDDSRDSGRKPRLLRSRDFVDQGPHSSDPRFANRYPGGQVGILRWESLAPPRTPLPQDDSGGGELSLTRPRMTAEVRAFLWITLRWFRLPGLSEGRDPSLGILGSAKDSVASG